MSEQELTELVRRIIAVEGTIEQRDVWLDLVAANTPMPLGAITDLIYYPERGATPLPVEVVKKALTYKPPTVSL